MKSLVHALVGYVDAIFKDIAPTYRSVSEWERDRNRSLHELANRGERMLTLDWPALRKHFEKCLEEGMYIPSGLYLSRRTSRKIVVPAFMRDLYLQIFDSQGKLKQDPNVDAIADIRQVYEGFGKLKNPCQQEDIDAEVDNFVSIEEALLSPDLNWDSDILFEDPDSTRSLGFLDLYQEYHTASQKSLFEAANQIVATKCDLSDLQKVCDIISSQFGDLHLEKEGERPELPKHGTGRVSNLKKEESKFDFSFWPLKLDRIFPFDRYAVHDLSYTQTWDDSCGWPRNHEHPSKLIAVPKTMSGPRLIASEPNYHQWIQQLIRNQIERRISDTALRSCVSFGNQEPNRALALSSSSTGAFATVDLKSASDRLSCWTVERAFRANITMLERIHASRTRVIMNAINDRFDRLILKKCFTQGSACTFPVQTVVYSMVAIAACIIASDESVTVESINRHAPRVRVFGDDIIVPVSALRKLHDLLAALQLKVNDNKTFSKGKFRESCGLDAYDGVDVTPARVKRFSCNPTHEIVQSMLESSNNFFRRGLWHTSMWLQSYLRRYSFKVVHIHDSDGYASFCGQSVSHLVRRWNSAYQRYEVKAHQLRSQAKKVPTQSAHDLMEFLTINQGRKEISPLSVKEGGLGIVYKKTSVMRSGWIPEIESLGARRL